MTGPNTFPSPRTGEYFNPSLQGPNALTLDGQRLGQLASGVREHGITRMQLLDVGQVVTQEHHMLSHVVGTTGDTIMYDLKGQGADVVLPYAIILWRS